MLGTELHTQPTAQPKAEGAIGHKIPDSLHFFSTLMN
jgi:hypothetical protein